VLDRGSLDALCAQVIERFRRVDILINCAARGIMTNQLTSYGVDRHMAVNHMGHVILTSHLLALMKATAEKTPSEKVRLVMFGSNAHQ
jgi:NAD(P)-dependent dehydrogenase (short-subunit alcohol dehydrogenase family)